MQHQILFGKYELTGLLGAGASGCVYLARHRSLHQDRAIKCISKQFLDQEQLHPEAELLKSLKHPGIPIIYDLEEDDENYYLIEEYVRGESLEAYMLHQTIISQTFILNIGRQLCDIIAYLHAQPRPVIYQDLKPEHIIVYGDQVKIVDFGIAEFAVRDGYLYPNHGTLDYAAPEKRKGSLFDERVDIYGIGAILHDLEQHLPEKDSDGRLQQIIQKAMAPDPKMRYDSVLHLQEQLCQLEVRLKVKEGKGFFKQKKHLQKPKSIAVIGSRPGIGATHFAISYNVYLNRSGIQSLYVEQDHSGDLLRLESGPRIKREQDLIIYGDFRASAIREMGRSSILSDKEQGMYQLIRDFGTSESYNIELEECDEIILIVGGRDWEIEQTQELYNRMCLHRHLIPVVNYDNRRAAKQYAKNWQRNVYCFPLDGDPMNMTKDKMRFFNAMHGKG